MSRRTSHPGLRLLRRLFVVALAGWLACLTAILAWSIRNSDEHADAIVVLGAAQYSGRPSPVLRARLDQSMALWNADRAPRIIFTGGKRDGDLVSEAAAGRKFATSRGVPGKVILLEATGRTSLASMHGAAVLLKTRGDTVQVPMAERPRVLLVSDPFHMLRLDLLARLHGLTPLLSPTRTSPISANWSVAAEYILRESFALPADLLTLLWLYLRGHSDDVVADG